MAEPPPLAWVRCTLGAGHGVASGQAASSPYPAGTIALQTPLFRAQGIDLSPYFAGTLNLEVPGRAWRLRDPAARVEQLRWSEHHPPETFSFWPCRLRLAWQGPASPATPPAVSASAEPTAGATAAERIITEALIYHPHPQTKRAHHQREGCLEVLAPWLGQLPTGSGIDLGVDPRRCRLIDPARLRARLLEFLKFRVLAAQEAFFSGFRNPQTAAIDPALVRAWLPPLWPEALDLSDADLLLTLEQARSLYLP
ncbi:MAG: hypothetical protein ACKOZT_02370 [Cyanobium sp.]